MAPEPEAALKQAKREWAALLQWAPRPAWSLAKKLPTGPPSLAPEPEAALNRAKREWTALMRLAPRPA